eukprot:683548-Pleurochrysis_carterae.AAC.1
MESGELPLVPLVQKVQAPSRLQATEEIKKKNKTRSMETTTAMEMTTASCAGYKDNFYKGVIFADGGAGNK